MKTFAVVLSGFLMLSAVSASAGQPPKPTSSTDPDHCTWVWLAGGGIGAWTEQCKFDTGLWHLKFNDTPSRFSLFVDDENTGVVLAPFAKPADAGIEALLPELRRLRLIPDDDECIFRPASSDALASVGPTPRTRAYFEIMPTGKRKAAFDATPADDVPEPPCGDVGFDPDGIRLFMTDVTHPTGVIYMNLGQDGTMFDPRSVTWETP
jgi:hypothetical protein